MNRESREEVLARLLSRALELLEAAAACLVPTDEARAIGSDVADYLDDCRDHVATLITTQWAAGEAPPGVERLQAEVRAAQAAVAAEERRKARNKRRTSARGRA